MTITDAVKKQIVKLEADNVKERNSAIKYLSKKKNPEIVQLLISLLKEDTSPKFREGACRILGNLKAKEAVDEIVNCLNDEDESVKYFAAIALGEISDSKATKPIIRIIKRKQTNSTLKSELIAALGNIGDDHAVDILINVLRNDKDKFVRHNAARALGKLKNKKALGALSEVAKREKITRLHYLALDAINEINKDN